MAETPTYSFLDQTGVSTLANGLLAKANLRIAERIVQAIDGDSPATQVLSAQALYGLLGNTGSSTVASQLSDLDTSLTSLTTRVNNLTHLTVQTIEGALDDDTTMDDLVAATDDPLGEAGAKLTPRTDVLYLQRDSSSDPTWVMYICQSVPEGENPGVWIAIGDTSIDLVNYWSKSDTDVAALRTALAIHDATAITDAAINSAVDAAFAANDPLNTGAGS